MSLLGCIKVRLRTSVGITKLEAAWLTCKWVNSADSVHLHLDLFKATVCSAVC